MLSGEDVDRVSGLIAAIGTADFGDTFFGLCRSYLGADHCTVFQFHPAGNPHCILATAQSSNQATLSVQLAREYTAGAFSRDPNFGAINEMLGSATDGSLSVRRMAPSRILDPTYRRSFYEVPHIREKIFAVAQVGQRTYYTSLYREEETGLFQQSDLDALHHLAPMLVRAVSRHADLLAGSDGPRVSLNQPVMDLAQRVKTALLGHGSGLTLREVEVLTGIVLGKTSEGIGLSLGITPNTVATHRKRAYAKLGISSQNELFARCLDS